MDSNGSPTCLSALNPARLGTLNSQSLTLIRNLSEILAQGNICRASPLGKGRETNPNDSPSCHQIGLKSRENLRGAALLG